MSVVARPKKGIGKQQQLAGSSASLSNCLPPGCVRTLQSQCTAAAALGVLRWECWAWAPALMRVGPGSSHSARLCFPCSLLARATAPRKVPRAAFPMLPSLLLDFAVDKAVAAVGSLRLSIPV